MNMTEEQINNLLYGIRDISHGGLSGPKGLEAVAMAIGGCGDPGSNNVASALNDIALSIRDLADAIRDNKAG